MIRRLGRTLTDSSPHVYWMQASVSMDCNVANFTFVRLASHGDIIRINKDHPTLGSEGVCVYVIR